MPPMSVALLHMTALGSSMSSATHGTFIYRHWDERGHLICEYLVDACGQEGADGDVQGGVLGESTRRSSSAELPRFLAGDLSTLHGKRHDSAFSHYSRSSDNLSIDRHQRHHHLIDALKNHSAHHLPKPTIWERLLIGRRKRARPRAGPESPQSDTTSTSSAMSLEAPQHLQAPRNTLYNMSTAPVPREKKEGFFKRLSHHGRKKSEFAAARKSVVHTTPSPEQSRPSTAEDHPPPPSQPIPVRARKSALRRPSDTNGFQRTYSDDNPTITLNGAMQDDVSGVSFQDEMQAPPGSPKSTKGRGIQWAENHAGEEPSVRPRRTSSAATHGRRSSIYSRAADGDYDSGVAFGAGSKARRLSIALPESLHVDECPLEEYFSYWSRHHQEQIGEGGAAMVKLMKSKTAGECQTKKDTLYAVKQFRPRDPAEETAEEYERKIKSEYAISKACEHPNVVKTFRLCHGKDDQWYHVMEYCEQGDLNDLLQNGHFKPEDRNCMFKQLVRGVQFLHHRGIAHRDLKSENLLVTSDGCLKIADFGTGEVFSGRHPGLRNCRRQSIIDPNDEIRLCEPGWVGSKPYMAPEIISRKGQYDPRTVDVWSIGIVYATMCFLGNPWVIADPSCKNYNIYLNTWDQWLDKYPDGEIRKGRELPAFAYTKQFMSLDDQGTKIMLFGMLHPDPQKRWTIDDIIEWKTVHEYECCQQDGYSDDIKTRQKKALHNHKPKKPIKSGLGLSSPRTK